MQEMFQKFEFSLFFKIVTLNVSVKGNSQECICYSIYFFALFF